MKLAAGSTQVDVIKTVHDHPSLLLQKSFVLDQQVHAGLCNDITDILQQHLDLLDHVQCSRLCLASAFKLLALRCYYKLACKQRKLWPPFYSMQY